MRILVQTLGSAGDVHPFLGIGRALAARGHDVHVLANEVFGDVVRGAGLAFVPCGDAEGYHRSTQDPALWDARRGVAVVMRDGVVPTLEPTWEALRALAVPGETVVLISTLGFAGRSAAEALHLPLVVAHLAPSIFRSIHRAPRYPALALPRALPAFLKRAAYALIDREVDPLVLPALNAFRARLGLSPVARVFDRWVHEGDACLALFPDWFAPPEPDWPPHLETTGFPLFDESAVEDLNADLSDWLDAGTAPIVFTAGSANVFGEAYYRAGIEASRALGRRAVLVTRNDALLPRTAGDDVLHVAHAPFDRLLPRAAAVVHHGGVGTMARALAAGVVQLVAPMGFDQFDNAVRLAEVGAGGVLSMRRFRARRARKALGRLLADERFGRAAAEAARRIRGEDAVARACRAVEAVAAPA